MSKAEQQQESSKADAEHCHTPTRLPTPSLIFFSHVIPPIKISLGHLTQNVKGISCTVTKVEKYKKGNYTIKVQERCLYSERKVQESKIYNKRNKYRKVCYTIKVQESTPYNKLYNKSTGNYTIKVQESKLYNKRKVQERKLHWPCRMGSQSRMELLMNTMPLRDTVAGEALSMLCTSKMILQLGAMGMRSPLARVKVLLSSSTEFRFSIQIASTGPSSTSQMCSPWRNGWEKLQSAV